MTLLILLTDDNIKYLKELRTKDLESYNRKLYILGLNDNDVLQSKVEVTTTPSIYDYSHRGNYFTADPILDELDDYSECDRFKDEYFDEVKGRLFLVDGDNHVYEGLAGAKKIREEDSVLVYITQLVLRNRLSKRYKNTNGKINFKIVPEGEQAVDNQIKSRFGNAVLSGNYTGVYIVSQDKGYQKLVNKYKGKELSVKMALIPSIKKVVVEKSK